MSKTIAVTEIPVESKEVRSFRLSDIKVISETDRAGIEQLAAVKVKEPLFAVVDGDRNYIYSFSKVFAGIKKEHANLKERKFNMIMFCVISLCVGIGCLSFLKFNGPSPNADMLGYAASFIFFVCLWDLIKTRYTKMINNLNDKKTYVLTESQDYLQQLKEDAKKPVLII
jgi:hypothetical protein